jgi:hypothetical protein
MKFYFLPVALLAAVTCFGAEQDKKRTFIKNGTEIFVQNQRSFPIWAYVKGFGIVETNGLPREYELKTNPVIIEAGNTYGEFQIPSQFIWSSYSGSKFVIPTLYASALMIRTVNEYRKDGDICTEVCFRNPFEQGDRKTFVIADVTYQDGDSKKTILGITNI